MRTTTTKTTTKPVFLRGLKPENHKWLKTVAKERGYTLSGFVNTVVEKARKEHGSHRTKV